ncbi:MAG: hypothetical protein KJO31_05340 [Gammaproteobacteria bacterium]|nr:hypothetical protein [Gammaproteobacteria bacterium]
MLLAQDYVDTERYPIGNISSATYTQLISRLRDELRSVGCAVVPGFIRAQHVPALVEEADSVAPHAHRSFNRTNAYFTRDDESLPRAHPVRRFYDRSNAFVPADNFAAQSPLRALYEWPPLMAFIRDALEERSFHRYADPLADVIINVVEHGSGFPWHFDTNNYTVTLSIQNGEAGGLFEYVPNLRSAAAENYAGVQAILDGDHGLVRSLQLNPGDLQIFKGRYSLHRVTAVQGQRRRYVGIFSFVDRPGMVAKVERAMQLYGRALPVHYAARKGENRNDDLLD